MRWNWGVKGWGGGHASPCSRPSLMKIVESRELPGPPNKTAYLTRHHSHNIAYVSPLPLSRRYFLEKHLNLTFFLLFPLFLAVSTEIAKTVWAVARKPSFLLSQVTCIYQCLQPFFVFVEFSFLNPSIISETLYDVVSFWI